MSTDVIDPLDMLIVCDQRNEGLFGLSQIAQRVEVLMASLEGKTDESDVTKTIGELVGTLGVVRFIAKTTIDNIHQMDKQR
jgi:hypothetical protein